MDKQALKGECHPDLVLLLGESERLPLQDVGLSLRLRGLHRKHPLLELVDSELPQAPMVPIDGTNLALKVKNQNCSLNKAHKKHLLRLNPRLEFGKEILKREIGH